MIQRNPGETYPRYARTGPKEDIETLWQRPPGEVKGMLFIAHGCNHQATDFFTMQGRDGWQFTGCEKSFSGSCLGLPEEVEMRRAARNRGYLVVTVSGGNGKHSCWDSRRDVDRVKLALQYVREQEGLQSVPLFATGASSGGALVGALAAAGVPHLKCVSPQVSAIDVPATFPQDVSIFFVPMVRDKGTAAQVQQNIQQLKKQGIRVAQQVVKESPLSDKFLENNGVGLTPGAADEAMASFRKSGVVNEHAFLKEDPRVSNWRQAVKAVPKSELGSTKPDASKLSELLNVAYAFHELTAQYILEMLNFCEGHA